MRIGACYSHLNGKEYLEFHRPHLLREVEAAIAAVNPVACRTYVSKAQKTQGRSLYAPDAMNSAIKGALLSAGWKSRTVTYWYTSNPDVVRETLLLSADEQKREILKQGLVPIRGSNQTDFWKDRVAVEVQFGHYASVAYDLAVKHMAFFVEDLIDVGIEVLPMKSLLAQMSSGPPNYEKELYNLIRGGRATPAVPLVLFGIEP